jgi:hypothetical protein
MNMVGLLSSVRISMLLKILPFALHTSRGFAKQILPILLILCYNGSLVISTVVTLTAVKVKSLIFPMSGFALSYTATANHTSNVSSIIVCSLVAEETTYPPSRCLAMAVVLSPVYTAVT